MNEYVGMNVYECTENNGENLIKSGFVPPNLFLKKNNVIQSGPNNALPAATHTHSLTHSQTDWTATRVGGKDRTLGKEQS
jgi:hypothetical protein